VIKKAESSTIGLILAFVAGLSTLAIAPWAAYDPVNLPKLLVISLGGFICLGLMLAQRNILLGQQYRVITLVAAAFAFDLVLVLLFAGNTFGQEFYGAQGRATGFVAYLALAGLLLAGVFAGSTKNLSRVAYSLLVTGSLSIAYGLVQAAGADPIKWVNQYSPVIGFLGNPNFQSSFVAFSAVMAFALVLDNRRAFIGRIALVLYQPLALYVIKESQSQQGFLVYSGSISIVVLIYFSKSRYSAITRPIVALSVLGAAFVALGSLNKGPLAALLYKDSVTFRGDYWWAGWKMTINHPVFGVGLDSYGDWYRRARTLEATVRRGPDVTSNSAHNVLLDLSSNGGFPLLFIYLAIITLVIRSALRVLRRSTSFNPVFAGIFAVWVGYQAQSVISLNQLGLAVWGWTLSGLIIGWDIYSSNTVESENSLPEKKKGKSAKGVDKQVLAPASILGIFVGLILALVMAVPPLAASVNYKSARESGKVQILIDSAYKKPLEATRMGEIAVILNDNKLVKESVKVITDAAKEFPDYYGIWAVMAGLPGVPAEQVTQAKAQMKRLDPFNPELK
jgi:O-antigen ligase